MEINCFVCGEPFITNEAIDVDCNTFIYICPECRERKLREVREDA